MQDTIDLSNTVFEEGSNPTLINVNGTEYLVGRDRHGYVTIAHVEVHESTGTPVAHTVGDYPYASFDDKRELLRAIEEA